DFMCEVCSNRKSISKKIEFVKLPKLLCFHIQRLVWLAGEQPLKRYDHVVFPEFFQMDPFVYQQKSAAVGKLSEKCSLTTSDELKNGFILNKPIEASD